VKAKHVITELREIIGLTQTQFGELIGRSLPVIQSIEIGRQRLNEEIAQEVWRQTGVNKKWLLENDASKPIRNSAGALYTLADFDLVQSFLSQSPDDFMGEKRRLHERLSELFAMGELALSKGDWRLFMFKLRKAVEVMAQSFQSIKVKSAPPGKGVEKATQDALVQLFAKMDSLMPKQKGSPKVKFQRRRRAHL
jgi:transcriptional regulator with XRE-family HTH domain